MGLLIIPMASLALCPGLVAGIIELEAVLTTSIAMTKTPSISKNGNNTKNQEIPLYPLEHKKFKNQVQAAIKMPLVIRLIS